MWPALTSAAVELLPCAQAGIEADVQTGDVSARTMTLSRTLIARAGALHIVAACTLRLDVLADERHHVGEHAGALRQVRRMAGMALHRDIFERDIAAGLAIIGAETLRLIAGKN